MKKKSCPVVRVNGTFAGRNSRDSTRGCTTFFVSTCCDTTKAFVTTSPVRPRGVILSSIVISLSTECDSLVVLLALSTSAGCHSKGLVRKGELKSEVYNGSRRTMISVLEPKRPLSRRLRGGHRRERAAEF